MTEKIKHEDTIQWYKVHISLFDEKSFAAFTAWQDVITYLSHNSGWDVTVQSQHTRLDLYLNDSNVVDSYMEFDDGLCVKDSYIFRVK